MACSASPSSSVASQRASLESPELDIQVPYSVDHSHPLAHVGKWSCLFSLDEVTIGDRVERLAGGDDDMVVLDDIRTEKRLQEYDMAQDVARLHQSVGRAGKPKVVIAYASVGEIESVRYIWDESWAPGSPSWIVARDPDGWGANTMPVAFWRDEWHDLLYRNQDSIIARIVADGFDGVYMDWIEAASFAPVIAQAAIDGVDPKAEMVRLLTGMRARALASNPSFMLIAQNGTDMRDTPGYLPLLAGQSQEQIFYDGLANMTGDDPRQGDCRLPLLTGDAPPATNADYCSSLNTMKASSEEYVRKLSGYLAAGVPVFSLDYALDPDHAQRAYTLDDRFRFVGLVTRRSADDLTATPHP